MVISLLRTTFYEIYSGLIHQHDLNENKNWIHAVQIFMFEST
jgi:hypothetical protein